MCILNLINSNIRPETHLWFCSPTGADLNIADNWHDEIVASETKHPNARLKSYSIVKPFYNPDSEKVGTLFKTKKLKQNAMICKFFSTHIKLNPIRRQDI